MKPCRHFSPTRRARLAFPQPCARFPKLTSVKCSPKCREYAPEANDDQGRLAL